ncbi:S8/S53 family peptidase [Corynebacterium sp. HMSC27B11]|uniref:S8/S53 family peptidase n=1 Tax=Corynebacterium sp. HMSC27B11 TaxID=1581065 RepID=UPI0009F49872|nr:S8/S53 family peptidase [Corynebacterium sp. HMSC27B11]
MTPPPAAPARGNINLNCQEQARDPDLHLPAPAYPHDLATGHGSTIIVVDTGVALPGATGERDSCILHGTAVATTAAQAAPGAHIHSLRHASRPDAVEGTVEELVTALDQARKVKAKHKIVNVSMVTCEPAPALEKAVRELVADNALVVAPIGNMGQCDAGAATFPASLPGVLSVGAVENDTVMGAGGAGSAGGSAATSTAGAGAGRAATGGGSPGDQPAPAVLNSGRVPAAYGLAGVPADIYAPGGPVVAQVGDSPPVVGSPEPFIGTSFAAPVVSGVAAMVWQLRPELTAAEVTGLLRETAQPGGAIDGVEGLQTARVVDPSAALSLARDQQRNHVADAAGQDHRGDGAVERAQAGLPGGPHDKGPGNEAGAHDAATSGAFDAPGDAVADVPVAVTAAPVAEQVTDYRVPLALSAVLAVALVLVLVARAFASESTPPSGSPEITRQGT